MFEIDLASAGLPEPKMPAYWGPRSQIQGSTPNPSQRSLPSQEKQSTTPTRSPATVNRLRDPSIGSCSLTPSPHATILSRASESNVRRTYTKPPSRALILYKPRRRRIQVEILKDDWLSLSYFNSMIILPRLADYSSQREDLRRSQRISA